MLLMLEERPTSANTEGKALYLRFGVPKQKGLCTNSVFWPKNGHVRNPVK